jgi:hypothetical protein
LTDADVYKSVYDYINAIPQEMKADAETVARRLEACKACDMLFDGLCRICGCFVEARASKKPSICPNNVDLWS